MVVFTADVPHVNYHPPALAVNRVSMVEFQVEFEDIHSRFADKSQITAAAVLRQDRTYLIRADVPCLGHPGDLEVGVGRRDVRIQATAAGGDGIGRNLWGAWGSAADRYDLAARVVFVELCTLDPNAFI